jgi:hypothetical protein
VEAASNAASGSMPLSDFAASPASEDETSRSCAPSTSSTPAAASEAGPAAAGDVLSRCGITAAQAPSAARFISPAVAAASGPWAAASDPAADEDARRSVAQGPPSPAFTAVSLVDCGSEASASTAGTTVSHDEGARAANPALTRASSVSDVAAVAGFGAAAEVDDEASATPSAPTGFFAAGVVVAANTADDAEEACSLTSFTLIPAASAFSSAAATAVLTATGLASSAAAVVTFAKSPAAPSGQYRRYSQSEFGPPKIRMLSCFTGTSITGCPRRRRTCSPSTDVPLLEKSRRIEAPLSKKTSSPANLSRVSRFR